MRSEERLGGKTPDTGSGIVRDESPRCSSEGYPGGSPKVDVVMRPSENPAGLWCMDLKYSQRQKVILEGVTICAKPGELTMIMGASGSGKTSLINCLMSRVKRGTVIGEVGLNERVVNDDAIRTHARYVMSGDTALSYLTVEEVLFSTAQLRLPQLTAAEQLAATDEVIRWMQLDCCRKTLIGGSWRKGVSRGQLKRIAIAQELLGSPEVLVLDEPTTGLDASLALELVNILRDVARKTHKTIVASVHQPRQRAFELFDSLVLLYQGRIIYHGPANQALNWFGSFGLKQHERSSVPDFLLEVATNESDIHNFETEQRAAAHALIGAEVDSDCLMEDGDAFKPQYSTSKILTEIIEQYPKSVYAADIKESISALRMNPIDTSKARTMRDAQRWTAQFKVLWKRTTLNSMRNPMTAFIILLVNIIQALILGALFFRLNSDMKSITTKNLMDWSIWDNDVFRYLSEGLDKNMGHVPPMDPLRDMFERGIDGADTSLVLDLANTPGMGDYFFDMVSCLRTWLPPFKQEGANRYPEWNFPEGLLPGDDSIFEKKFDLPQPERIVTAVTGGLQILDGLTKWDWDFEPLTDLTHSSGFSQAAVGKLLDSHFGNAFCCLGFETNFHILGRGDMLKNCTDIGAEAHYKFPNFPEIPTWDDKKQAVHSSLAKTRKILTHYLGTVAANRKASTGAGSTGAGKTVRKLEVAGDLEAGKFRRAAVRRQLASGLGGLVTDLYSILFSDGRMKEMRESVIKTTERFRNCSNSYCQQMTRLLDTVYSTANDIATAFLSALNFSGALFFLVGNLGFASYDVLLSFPQARAVYNKEKADGLYRSSSFLLAKMVAELPWQLIPALVWGLIYFLMIGMDTSTASQFFTYIGIVVLISFTAYSLGYFISAMSPRLEVAITITPLIFLVMLILAGLMVRDPDLPKWIGWFRYLSIYRWAYFAVCANQFPILRSYGPLPNELVLTAIGVVERNVGISCAYLILLSVGCRLASYFALVFMHRKVGLEA